ncbi:hypothetical protein [Spiroplasma poulsonii]|uniref:Uncharacterized protein n=2 Tax=Spiroplasma TaxID=2132 RepID=A0A2P6FDP1_9MOLU|nr:hypothetical protein [Spiroplasma poulsonii]KAF0850565.1 GDSL-like Lipase/Acylhydrolase [Spiroplasma poulsonii]PQM31577.1 hypothetical protein SMSRO_SF014160 [Spiroplasma poulsonii]PWF96595.1 hypothetical protein SMSE_20420 [Spiroplasma poulsonii]PWF97171.1 hypothetical protein SMH99_19800 [Spiroplasma poulsonii]
MSPPNMGLVPEFNNKSVNQKSKEIITNFSKMFNQKTAEIVKNINGHYKNVVKQWSLYNNMSNLFEEFKKLRENADVTVNFSRSTPLVVGRMLGEILANPNPDVPKDANPDDYFFFDQLHPSWQIHQIVANKLYDFVQEW